MNAKLVALTQSKWFPVAVTVLMLLIPGGSVIALAIHAWMRSKGA